MKCVAINSEDINYYSSNDYDDGHKLDVSIIKCGHDGEVCTIFGISINVL